MKKILFLLIISAIFFDSCREYDAEFPLHPVKLSSKQIKRLNFDTIRATSFVINDTITVAGELLNIPDELYSVCLPVPGFVKTVMKNEGKVIQKNDLLAILEYPAYLDLKSNYLKAQAAYINYKNNFQRQGELAIDNATSIKKMQMAELDYRSAEIEYKTLEKKLTLLGINPEKLTLENLNPLAFIYAPVSGKIEAANINCGKYYTNEEVLFTISTQSKMVARFEIENKYISENNTLKIDINYMHQTQTECKIISCENTNQNSKSIITVELPNDNNLSPGNSVKAYINIAYTLYKIPKNAIIEEKFCIISLKPDEFMVVPLEILSKDDSNYFVKNKTELARFPIVNHGLKKLSGMIKNDY